MVRIDDRLHDGQAQAGASLSRREERLEQPLAMLRRNAWAAVAHADVDPPVAGRMSLEQHHPLTVHRLPGVGHEIRQRAGQCRPATGEFSGIRIADHLQDHASGAELGFEHLQHFRQHGADPHVLRGLRSAAGEGQHFLDRPIEVLEPGDRTFCEPLPLGGRDGGGRQLRCIEQCCGQRGTDLVREFRRHFPHRRKAPVTVEQLAYGAGLRVVGEQHDAAGAIGQVALRLRQSPAVAQHDVDAVLVGECARRHLVPGQPHDCFADQRCGVPFAWTIVPPASMTSTPPGSASSSSVSRSQSRAFSAACCTCWSFAAASSAVRRAMRSSRDR